MAGVKGRRWGADVFVDAAIAVGALFYKATSGLLSAIAPGTSGHVLTSNGAGAAPSYQAIPATYTDEQAQDAVGTILVDSATIDFTYTDATPSITAAVIAGSIGPTQLASTAVTPATYGDATHVAQVTVDADGRITGAVAVAISGVGGGSGTANIAPRGTPTNMVVGDFTTVNSPSSFGANADGTATLVAAANASESWKMAVKTAPTPPYTITVAIDALLLVGTMQYGLCFRESSSAKFQVLALVNLSNVLNYRVSTGVTAALNANYVASTPILGQPLFMRIADDNTNRICSLSVDGVNFTPVSTVARTNILTANQVGICANSQNASVALNATVYSWVET